MILGSTIRGAGLAMVSLALLVPSLPVATAAEHEAAGEPQAETLGAAPRSATTARLNAYVEPHGHQSTYYFEYGQGTGLDQALPAGKDGNAGAGTTPVLVSEQLSGLQPGTTYRYRVVVEHAGGTVHGEEVEFTTRTLAEANPPARAYELINNPDKGNQSAGTIGSGSILPGGDQAFWSVSGGAPGSNTGAGDPFLATRTGAGWVSETTVPPAAEQYQGGSYHYKLLATSAGLDRFLFFVDQGVLSVTPYALVRVARGGGSEVLGVFPSANVDEARGRIAAGENLDDVIFPSGSPEQLYDYGKIPPEPVSIMPSGAPPTCGLAAPHGWKRPSNSEWIGTANPSRVFFVTAGDDCSSPPQLYRRDRASGTTTLISPPAHHGAEHTALFIAANPSASAAVFVTRAALVGEDQNTEWDIYRHDDGEGVSCLTCGIEDAEVKVENASNSIQPIVVSGDLSRVYFHSTRQLAVGARPGVDNLYVLRAGELRFVAHGVELDYSLPRPPDGSVLFFEAKEDLTGDGTAGARQLYRYDDDARSLECVSCRPGGPNHTPIGDPFLESAFTRVSRDTSTAAFVTGAALQPEDVNGAGDVYEWRSGVLRLVTDGETKFPIGFGAALAQGVDATGKNIAFSVAAPLTGFEGDGTANLYTARIGGGFKPPAPVPPCAGDACQGPLTPVPQPPAAASAAVAAAGNPNLRKRKRAQRLRQLRRQRAKQRQRVRQRQRAKQRQRAAAKRRAAGNRRARRDG